jgi:hypothetical protein
LQTDWRVGPAIDLAPILHGQMADYLETLETGETVRANEIMWQMLSARNGTRVATYYAAPTSGSNMLAQCMVEDWETPEQPLLRFALSLLNLGDVDEAIINIVAKKLLFVSPEKISKSQGKIYLKEQILAGVRNHLELLFHNSPENLDYADDLAACHLNMGILYTATSQLPLAIISAEKAQNVIRHAIENGMFIPDSTIDLLKSLKRKIQQKQEAAIPVHIPTAHRNANPEVEAQRNIDYQRKLAEWNALPWWRRIKGKKPER